MPVAGAASAAFGPRKREKRRPDTFDSATGGVSVQEGRRPDARSGRALRVVTLADGETVHNAFPDRDFKVPVP
jgi:hypothetical protein